MKEKTTKKRKSGTITIDPEFAEEASKYCKSNGLILKFFVQDAIREKIQKNKSK
jgi:hypothetical protein